jgi:hypothetical protein
MQFSIGWGGIGPPRAFRMAISRIIILKPFAVINMSH